MQWKLPHQNCKPWPDFSLEIKDSIILETGSCYQLKGDNGSGKTTFIRKVLIPYLLEHPNQQYILYVEQQVQSQFDAVKSYTVFRDPSFKMLNTHDMVLSQIKHIEVQLRIEQRPVMIIIDEFAEYNLLTNWIQKFTLNSVCLIYVSHTPMNVNEGLFLRQIEFVLINNNHSLVNCNEFNFKV